MKFLIYMRVKSEAHPGNTPVPVLQATKQWLDARIADKTFDFVYVFPAGGGIALANFETPAIAMKALYDFPQFASMQTELLPLVDYKEGYNTLIEVSQMHNK